MSPFVLLLVYCLLIVAASLAGGKLSSLLRMTHLRTQLLMSGVGGLMPRYSARVQTPVRVRWRV